MNNTICTKEIPIKFQIGGQEHTGFLDPTTNIITQNGAPADCSLTEEIPIKIGNEFFLYQAKDGRLREAKNIPEMRMLFQWNSTGLWPMESTVFYAVVMHNFSELQSHVSMNDLLSGIGHQQQIFRELRIRAQAGPSKVAKQAISGIMSRGYFGFLNGLGIQGWQLWVLVVALM